MRRESEGVMDGNFWVGLEHKYSQLARSDEATSKTGGGPA